MKFLHYKKLASILKAYCRLTKWGITLFALISATSAYTLTTLLYPPSLHINQPHFSFSFFWLLGGLYLVISGGFILNQATEYALDSRMYRTKKRPIPNGTLSVRQATCLGLVFLVGGLSLLLALKPLTFFLSLLALFLYNIAYTLYWKKNWVFAAIPGALPGALPVMIGYSVGSNSIFSIECLYLFFLLFFWQMPHFWTLALHYKEDYKQAGLPLMPSLLGKEKTIFFMGLYLFFYLALASVSPLLFKMNFIYLFLLLPFCFKVGIEFFKFSRTLEWKPFFLWLNFSVLVFLWAPIGDLWIYHNILLHFAL